MKCPQGGQPGASPGRDGGVRRPATGVAGKEGSVGMEGASRAAWTRRGLRLPGPWVSHVRFSQAAIPDRLRHSWEAEWAGGGAQTQDQVASLRARVLPLTGWLCVPGQATLLGASASSNRGYERRANRPHRSAPSARLPSPSSRRSVLVPTLFLQGGPVPVSTPGLWTEPQCPLHTRVLGSELMRHMAGPAGSHGGVEGNMTS